MKTKTPLGVIALMSVLVAPGVTAQSAEEQVAERVLSFYQELNDGDAMAWASHNADRQAGNFVREGTVLVSGAPEPSVMQANFDSGAIDYNLAVRHLEVTAYGETAVATFYTTGPSLLASGQTITGTHRVSQVWVREDGDWKLAHFHISPLVS